MAFETKISPELTARHGELLASQRQKQNDLNMAYAQLSECARREMDEGASHWDSEISKLERDLEEIRQSIKDLLQSSPELHKRRIPTYADDM